MRVDYSISPYVENRELFCGCKVGGKEPTFFNFTTSCPQNVKHVGVNLCCTHSFPSIQELYYLRILLKITMTNFGVVKSLTVPLISRKPKSLRIETFEEAIELFVCMSHETHNF